MFQKPANNQVINYLLHEQDADIICLQEVEVYKDPQKLTLHDLKKALGAKYPYSYFDFSVYNKRLQFGNVIFSRYPLIHKRTIRYPSRSNISSQCDVIIQSDTIRLITNHLESNRFEEYELDEIKQKYSVAHKARVEQAKRVREAIEKSPHPLIVVGDLNDLPLSTTYWHIRGMNMRDAFLCTSWGRYGATIVKSIIALRIDYILCSENLHPQECRVPHVPYSDHYPVIATIEW